MESNVHILLPLLVILLTGMMVSELLKHIKLPFASAIILIGALIGPHGTGHIQHNEVITFFGFLGSAFLMFMAGLETDVPALKKMRWRIAFLTAVNGLVPLAVGIFITRLFGYPWVTAFLMGTIFLSSSVAIVFSVINTLDVKKDVSQIILSTAIFEDILSLFLFAVVMQSIQPITALPLPGYFALLILSLIALKLLLPRLASVFIRKKSVLGFFERDDHEDKLRFTIIVLIATLLYFSLLGVHPILAAFFVGLLLSQEAMGADIYTKIHTLSYGLFVPVFFFIIGMELDFGVLLEAGPKNLLTASIVAGLIISKSIGGYVGGRLTGMGNRGALSFGIVSTTQLTTTLAVAYAAFSANLLDQRLMTSCIVLAVVTNIFVPLGMRAIR